MFMPAAKTEKRKEAVRLRVEERLSGNEIARRLGVAKSSVCNWVKDYPLTPKERSRFLWRPGRIKREQGESSKAYEMTMGRDLSRQEKGKIAEAAVMFRLVLCGFNVFGSVFDGDSADWMVEDPETKLTHRVQVRWARPERYGLPAIKLRFGEGRGKTRPPQEGDFDFIVGYDLFTDTCYVWSWDEVKQYTSMITTCREAEEQWSKLRG
jgi:transposase-like protein